MTKSTVFVCTSCGVKEGKISAGNGAALCNALQNELADDDDIHVQAVGCLSNCEHGISVAITGHGKFGWVSGGQSDDSGSVAAIIHAARVHVRTPDGFLPKDDRVRPVIARIPYVGFEGT